MIEFNVTDQRIQLVSATSLGDNLVSNTANNYKCKFNFNEIWDGYGKIVVFMRNENEEDRVSKLLDENNECYIPLSVLQNGDRIRIGVYGKAEGKSLPTVYSNVMLVRLGALPNPSDVPPEEEGLYEQLLNKYAKVVEFTETFYGGETGQVLVKKSNENNDFEWKTVEIQGVTESRLQEALTDYAKVEELDELDEIKMEYAILSFDGTSFKLDGVTKTFSEIKELCLDKKNFVYLSYSNRLYIPQYINENNVWFEASYIDNEIPYMHRIGINSRNSVSVATKSLAVKSDMDTVKEDVVTLKDSVASLEENKVDDVQINGESIVADGVANVPAASNTTAGAVFFPAWSGIVCSDGNARISEATQSQIVNRAYYNPIVPHNLDYAVKASLTDNNSLVTWSDAEKKAARERIGGTFEKLMDVTLSEAVGDVSVLLSKSYTELVILINNERSVSIPNYNLYYVIGTALYLGHSTSTANSERSITDVIMCGDVIDTLLSASGNSNAFYAATSYVVNRPHIDHKGKEFHIRGDWNGSQIFPIGTKFEVYGRS